MIPFTPPTTFTHVQQLPIPDSFRQPLNAAGVTTRLSLASGSRFPFNISTSAHRCYHIAPSLARSGILPRKCQNLYHQTPFAYQALRHTTNEGQQRPTSS
ncbi:hypothetical protein L198_06297 [Cryptococcus wingfieldii CBS 7118]|uniref:Uncharacterized protein n=1 Tax=Cryptococcus wingfieldii CBS 7118 TaxID=1295528 RepID=A0A1E3ILY7_9TREE|nr:hypothetical protein L198_06297 [Cryptococcus wingfieldii CBS 7118]ODN89610.1 hypothetical protein L198_06297 [Cryptococcus wingfieldii CBS 7118]